MDVIWHNHVSTNPSAMQRTLLCKPEKAFVQSCVRKKLSSRLCTCRHEVDWRSYKHELKPTQARRSIFGGHRPPLQLRRTQRVFAERRMLSSLRGWMQSSRN